MRDLYTPHIVFAVMGLSHVQQGVTTDVYKYTGMK